ncbi:MAG: isoprenylcysteine carboxylmethyltransferase family protein [Pseudomonadota bacterium]
MNADDEQPGGVATSGAEDDTDHADVSLHPPTVFLIAFGAAWALRLITPFLFPDGLLSGRAPLPRAFGDFVGGLLIVAGVALMSISMRLFQESGQKLSPKTETPSLIEAGPYKFSRNPIYVAMVLMTLGLGLAANNLWMIVFSFIAFAVVHFGVVVREEAYLSEKFGPPYDDYRRRVRRYL